MSARDGAARADRGRERGLDRNAPVFVVSVAAEMADMHPQTLRQYDRLGLVQPGRAGGGGRTRGRHRLQVVDEDPLHHVPVGGVLGAGGLGRGGSRARLRFRGRGADGRALSRSIRTRGVVDPVFIESADELAQLFALGREEKLDIATLTGGFIYERRLLMGLRQAGHDVRHLVLPASFPDPSAADMAARPVAAAFSCPSCRRNHTRSSATRCAPKAVPSLARASTLRARAASPPRCRGSRSGARRARRP